MTVILYPARDADDGNLLVSVSVTGSFAMTLRHAEFDTAAVQVTTYHGTCGVAE